MAQRRPSIVARGDTALLIHIGGQLQSRDAVANKDRITEPDVNLQDPPTSHNHQSRHAVGIMQPVKKGAEPYTIDRQPASVEASFPASTMHLSGQDALLGKGSAAAVMPAQRWQLEAAKAQPWNGLGQVSRNSKATTAVSQAGRRSKTSSMETRKDSTSRASSNGHGRQKGCV
jgi:hypothetical protein